MNKSDVIKLCVAGVVLLAAGAWWFAGSSDVSQENDTQVQEYRGAKPVPLSEDQKSGSGKKKNKAKPRSRINEDIG